MLPDSCLIADRVISSDPHWFCQLAPQVTIAQWWSHHDGSRRASHPAAPNHVVSSVLLYGSWSHADIALAEPEYPPNQIDSWLDDPNLGGAGPSAQPHESIDLPSFYPPWPPAVSMAGPLANPPQDFYFGSTATPLMDQGYNSSTFTHTSAHQQPHSLNNFETFLSFDSMGYTDSDTLTGLVQQEHLSSIAETTNVLSLIGTNAEWVF